jgi:hypothetical protein
MPSRPPLLFGPTASVPSPCPTSAGGRRAPRGAGRAVALTGACAALAASAGAQPRPTPRVTLDVGASSVAYTAASNSTLAAQRSATVSPALHLTGGLAALDAVGTWAQPAGAGAGWSAQGALVGSVFTPGLGPLRAEFTGTAAGSTHRDATRTGRVVGGGRLHAMGTGRGLWAGGSTGRVWDGLAWRTAHAGDAGAWVTRRGVTALVTAVPTVVAPGAGDAVRYTDVESGVRWAGARLELGAAAGTRLGRSPGALAAGGRTAWGSASVTAWVLPRLALVGGAGSYPIDFTQSFPGGRFATVGVRLAGGVPGSIPGPARRARLERSEAVARGAEPPAALVTPAAAPTLRVAGGAGAARLVRVEAPGAASVSLTGEPTGWRPVALRRAADGVWTATLPLRAGTQQVAVRVDGGAWRAPAGLTVVHDEFGGEAGLLVVAP